MKTKPPHTRKSKILSADSLSLLWRTIDFSLAHLDKIHAEFCGRIDTAKDASPYDRLAAERRALEQARSEVGAVFKSQFADEEAMKSALAFYADYDESLWEEADSVAVGKSPVVHRKAISGTCHPREVARKALLGKCK